MSPATDPIGHGRQTPPGAGDRQDPEVTLRASLRLLTEAEGGLSKPVGSGCALLARFGSDDLAPDVGRSDRLRLAGLAPVSRGRRSVALDVGRRTLRSSPGTALRVYQGSHLIGVGTIQ